MGPFDLKLKNLFIIINYTLRDKIPLNMIVFKGCLTHCDNVNALNISQSVLATISVISCQLTKTLFLQADKRKTQFLEISPVKNQTSPMAGLMTWRVGLRCLKSRKKCVFTRILQHSLAWWRCGARDHAVKIALWKKEIFPDQMLKKFTPFCGRHYYMGFGFTHVDKFQ